MTGNRRRTLAQAAAALLGLLMLMAGTVAVIEASAHLLELDPVLLPWRRTSARLADLRAGDGWVRAAGVGFVAVGLLLGVLGTAPRHRRTLAVGGNDRPTWARVDIVDVQRGDRCCGVRARGGLSPCPLDQRRPSAGHAAMGR